MFLTKNHKTIKAALVAGLLLTPVIASASLTIVNNTSSSSTSIINSVCSTALGDQGVTKPHSSNEVSDFAIQLACGFTPNNCIADVRMSGDCSGASMATIVFDVQQGVKSAVVTPAGQQAGYTIAGQGFSVSLSGGAAVKK